MISTLVSGLRPLIEPLLKLRFEPPTLPEGSQTLRKLKPSERYLAYAYTRAMLSHVGPLLAVPALMVLELVVGGYATVSPLLAAILILALTLSSLAVSLVVIRLDWELRDYLIGSRSLRLREGAFVQRELTLSYANVQNVEVTQGPLERLFGFKSLRVSTAGGSRGTPGEHGAPSHEARLVGLEDAEGVRDLVLGALRQQRDAGLGDPSHEVPRTRTWLLEEIRDAAAALHLATGRRTRRTSGGPPPAPPSR
ncbi:PH domain-containing protein [Archangium violaceum]|uniref:PH domain-containing protein n=1 Tax=Archangium violaceum TaxID=83451 RepID=UPI001950A796|nr:PH domain-containing protein [Archangium violaceum]QRN97032.1 PH domain-containing protein [Archangium violaceum]